MDTPFGFLLVIAMILGVIKGLTDDKPSFWRGLGEGMAGRGKFRGGTYFFFHGRGPGPGIGFRIDED